jgi:response regulator RpfG family c-di-GMP phosphodiesterase
MPELASPAAAAVTPPAAAAVHSGGQSAGTLLLVDDEPSVLSALRRLYRGQGYKIEQATSAADALVLMQTQPIDLVISDMRMPEMDGAAFLEAVRDRHPGTVRILLTGYADINSTVAAINRGEIHRYIAKPWDDQDMLLVVSEALKRRDLEKQNAQLQALTLRQNDELRDLNQTLESRVLDRTSALVQTNCLLEEANKEVRSQFTLAVTVFSGLIEMRQDGIAGHARRVAELAQRVAVQLNRGEREQQEIRLAALLHDIGQIGFADAMLGKPVSSLRPDEMLRYRRHPLDGQAALMALDKLHGVALIVRQHHERVDGRGFPDGLSGDDICLGARIVAAASDYDDPIHGNLAEQRYGPEQARRALRGGQGSHYDPDVVAALFDVLDQIAADAVADVEIAVVDLQPLMTLSTDLLTARGAILLPKGYVFQPRVIQQVKDFAARENLAVVLRITRQSIKTPLPPRAPGAAALGPAAKASR